METYAGAKEHQTYEIFKLEDNTNNIDYSRLNNIDMSIIAGMSWP